MLADAVLHDQSDEAFCRHLLRITGGNPFLVHETLGAALVDDVVVEADPDDRC